MHAISSPQAREESEAERIDRNLADLLQELRVAGLGVQMLFGFLLALPFTVRFSQLNGAQRDVYRLSLLAAAATPTILRTAGTCSSPPLIASSSAIAARASTLPRPA